MERYIKNRNMLSQEENNRLKGCKVCVIGCGGLGGYIIEMLGRLGIGTITAIDGDVFHPSNLNRQLLSHNDSLGKNKALTAKERMKLVNPLIEVRAIPEFLSEENAAELLKHHHILVDALDNIPTRRLLQSQAEQLDIPLIHGAIAGWYGQVTTIFPGDRTLDILYGKNMDKGIESSLGNPSFTPALVASIQVSEVLKVLIGRGHLLRQKVLYINTLDQEYHELALNDD